MQGTTRTIRAMVVAMLLTLTACAPSQDGDAKQGVLDQAPPGTVVAVINGETLTEPLLLAYAKQRNLDPTDSAQRQQALDALIDTVLLAQDAIASGIDEDPSLRAELMLSRAAQQASHRMSDQRANLEVSEQQILQLYQREKERAGDTQWQVEHMLFGDEATAKAWLDRALLPGADFSALMTEAQAAGARQSRALGWTNATQLPPELVEALKQMEDGTVAPVVIRSEYGFHVLRRVAARPFSPPPLEQIREGAKRQISEAASREFLESLRKRAKIVTSAEQPSG